MMTKVNIEWPSEYFDQDNFTDPQIKGFLEGYAMALAHMMSYFTGDSPCGKSYDPFCVDERGEFHSYAFNMKDGGRHHPFKDYKDVGEVCNCLKQEAISWIQED